MVIRQGFVSNSSSTSFYISLDSITKEQYDQIIKFATDYKRTFRVSEHEYAYDDEKMRLRISFSRNEDWADKAYYDVRKKLDSLLVKYNCESG